MRDIFYGISFVCFAVVGLLSYFSSPHFLWALLVIGPLFIIGMQDVFSMTQTVKRNFPVIGRFRYFFELIRPEIQQYFIETNTEGAPFSREQRSVVYQRAKKSLDTLPFGTQRDVYAPGYEWLNHSIVPKHLTTQDLRIKIGGPLCKQPYNASILNISAMSFGALSNRAILSLNGGAKDGGFYHNTGEGGLSPYHLEPGGDIVWQVGTGYFGCRTAEGNFDADMFAQRVASAPQVKMVELKLSQGAKPGHGGILPARKVTPEIAKIRNVPMGKDVFSPPYHSAFNTPIGLLQFLDTMRGLCGGRPVGFKLCIGRRREFLAICKAMHESGLTPDFITIDGAEGGTGAAPLEFSNYLGSPLYESLIFVHNSLVGFNLRDKIRIIVAGKVTTGFALIKCLSLGADLCNSARGMMLALGCIQALRCNTNECPTGVATQNPKLVAGLHVTDKRQRVTNFHRGTVASVCEMLGAMGLDHTEDLRPWHIMRRIDQTNIRHYGEIYEYLNPGDLLSPNPPTSFARALASARSDTFEYNS